MIILCYACISPPKLIPITRELRMPAHKKTMNKVAQSAVKKNNMISVSIEKGEMPDAVFARIDSNLGSYFRLTYHDAEKEKSIQILGSPRGLFKQRKAQIRFSTDDIVILSSVPTRGTDISEIIALLDKKDAQDFYKKGLIHKSVYNAPDRFGLSGKVTETVVDDIFDYTGDVSDDEVSCSEIDKI